MTGVGTGKNDRTRRGRPRMAALGPPEFVGSLGLVAGLAVCVVVALIFDGNRPKALRVGLACAVYLATLVVGGVARGRTATAPRTPSLWRHALAGAAAGFVSGVVRSEVTIRIVLIQTLAAAMLLGSFHWWAARMWRRIYERITRRPVDRT